MEVKVKAINFEIADRLSAFIDKKAQRLGRHSDAISAIEFSLKVVKPETANNKQADLRIVVPGQNIVASKTADTFEEAIDMAIAAVERPLDRLKEQK